jgi:Protein of unknown function (DUF3618)
MGKDSSEIRREIDATRARMGDTVEALGYKADVPSRVKDAVSDRVETVKGSIGDAVGGVVDGVQNATQRVGEALGGAQRVVGGDAHEVRAAARRGVGIAAENPLGLAIGAAAIGFLAGLLVPVSEYERSTIGPLRDDLLERAQKAGGNALEHGKQVLAETARAAVQTAQQSAQEHAQQVAGGAAGATGRSTSGARGEYGALLND